MPGPYVNHVSIFRVFSGKNLSETNKCLKPACSVYNNVCDCMLRIIAILFRRNLHSSAVIFSEHRRCEPYFIVMSCLTIHRNVSSVWFKTKKASLNGNCRIINIMLARRTLSVAFFTTISVYSESYSVNKLIGYTTDRNRRKISYVVVQPDSV